MFTKCGCQKYSIGTECNGFNLVIWIILIHRKFNRLYFHRFNIDLKYLDERRCRFMIYPTNCNIRIGWMKYDIRWVNHSCSCKRLQFGLLKIKFLIRMVQHLLYIPKIHLSCFTTSCCYKRKG